DGAEATKELVGKKSRSRVLILTMHAEDTYLVPLLEAGVSGYLVKSAADRELIDAVRAVAHGDVYMQPSAARPGAADSTQSRARRRALQVREAHRTGAQRSALRGAWLQRAGNR